MTAREYLEKLPKDNLVTFIIAEAHHEVASFWSYRYHNTPMRMRREWLGSPEWGKDYLVINADCPPIDITGSWYNAYKRGGCYCAMIVTLEEMRKTYNSDAQFNDMVEYYNKNVN
jgi:hypothetical protein